MGKKLVCVVKHRDVTFGSGHPAAKNSGDWEIFWSSFVS